MNKKFAKEKQVIKQLKEILGDQYIEPEELVKPKMKPFCFMSFSNVEQKDKFCSLISENKQAKLRIGEVNDEKAFDRQLKKKIKKEQQQEFKLQQKQDQNMTREPFDRDPIEVAHNTAPLFEKSYEEQIKIKVAELDQVIQKFTMSYKQRLPKDIQIPSWLENKEFEIKAPIVCKEEYRNSYRNKSEFTINYNSQNQVCVGFNVGSFQKNNDSVERPNACPITPKIAIQFANQLEEYIKESEFKPFNRISGQGVWRLLSVRKSDRTKQVLLAISINKNNLNEEQYLNVKQDLINLFTKQQQIDYKITGIVLMHSEILGQDLPSKIEDSEIIFGQNFYEEIILGKIIKISYNAFVQNHTDQCDLMYEAIANLCENKKITKFLDICAGSGTIGMCVSDKVDSVLAIEMNEQACKDCTINYENNKIKNCEIICSKVEDVIKQEVQNLKQQKVSVLACLDPPRAGVIQSVVDCLRTCKGLDSIVYVSCSPYSVIENLIFLCMPVCKKFRAPGFKLKSIQFVDMFPQTSHFETIFYMERDYGFDPNEGF